MDVGTQLREARERRGMTLEDVAASTKVSKPTLDHIEHNRFARLAGGILTRGYLRAYAAEVGLNPEQIVGDYRVQCFGDSGEELPFAPPPPVEGERHPGRLLLVDIIAIAIAIAVYESYTGSAGAPAAEPSTRTRTLQATPALVSLDATVLPRQLPTSEGEPGVQIEIRPSGPCWVSATADDRIVIHRLLQSGERVVATANEELVLRVGDPETFEYSLNGVLGRPLGQANEPVTIRITTDNYDTFLSDPTPEGGRRLPMKAT